MCDILVINTNDDAFLHQCSESFTKRFRGCFQARTFIEAAVEIYDKRPPKAVLIDADNIDFKQAIAFVSPYIGYAIALTDDFDDKKLVKNLYLMGFSDVRPKKHLDSLQISLNHVVKKRENTIIEKIELDEGCFR